MSSITALRHAQSTNATYTDVMSSLQTVEINSIDLCNRACSFCPHGSPELYPNKNLKMSLSTIIVIANHLSAVNYANRVSFTGFGEPFLNKKLALFIKTIKELNPAIKWMEVNTNGDFITRANTKILINAGCSHLTISMYDRDVSVQINKLLYNLPIVVTFKHLYTAPGSLVSRIDIVRSTNLLNLNKQCYVPFYKMFIDWDGSVLLCNNDWGREGVIDNVHNQSIKDIWLSDKFFSYREMLHNYSRTNSPCNKCDIAGTLYGASSVDVLTNFVK